MPSQPWVGHCISSLPSLPLGAGRAKLKEEEEVCLLRTRVLRACKTTRRRCKRFRANCVAKNKSNVYISMTKTAVKTI